MSRPEEMYESLYEEISTVLVGHERLVEHLTISLLTQGHVLIEGLPGIAKTTSAKLFAQALGLEYKRIQMTPDLLPADIVGSNVYRENTGEFEFNRGPIFSNIVVADELNRATAKTQSALLEAMAEGHVTIEGETFDLPDIFLVVATQTPMDLEGTFELPEVQRDRFQCKLSLSRPTRDEELELLNRFDADPTIDSTGVGHVISEDEVQAARKQVTDVYLDERVKRYILDFIHSSNDNPNVEIGASPRASLAFMQMAKARASIRGRDFVLPDDVKALAEPVLGHRLILETDAELSGMTSDDVVRNIADQIDAPESGDNVVPP